MKFPWQAKKQPVVLSPLEGYERWASTYTKESNPIKKSSDDLVKQMLPNLAGKKILDAGCGTGYFCKLAEAQLAQTITAIDLSPAMIAMAKQNCTYTQFRCEDLVTASLEKKYFDVIISSLVLGHIADLQPVLSKLLDALQPGGIILISDFHPFLTFTNSQRTFRDPKTGQSFAIRQHLHLLQDYVSAFSTHDVVLEDLKEPFWNNLPVIFALRARKK